jgi:hypothetical protein
VAAPAHSHLRQTHSRLRKPAIRTLICSALRLRRRVEARASLRPAGRRERHLPQRSRVRVARARAMSCAEPFRRRCDLISPFGSRPFRFDAPPAAYRCYRAARAALSDASCVFRVACCVLHVACCLLRVACCMLSAVGCITRSRHGDDRAVLEAVKPHARARTLAILCAFAAFVPLHAKST